LRELVWRGRWEYTANGTLDRTHLRFFTRRSLASLFDPEHCAVERIVPRFALGPGSKSRLANRLTLGLLDPHSRQPAYKQSAIRIEKIADQIAAARLSMEMRKF